MANNSNVVANLNIAIGAITDAKSLNAAINSINKQLTNIKSDKKVKLDISDIQKISDILENVQNKATKIPNAIGRNAKGINLSISQGIEKIRAFAKEYRSLELSIQGSSLNKILQDNREATGVLKQLARRKKRGEYISEEEIQALGYRHRDVYTRGKVLEKGERYANTIYGQKWVATKAEWESQLEVLRNTGVDVQKIFADSLKKQGDIDKAYAELSKKHQTHLDKLAKQEKAANLQSQEYNRRAEQAKLSDIQKAYADRDRLIEAQGRKNRKQLDKEVRDFEVAEQKKAEAFRNGYEKSRNKLFSQIKDLTGKYEYYEQQQISGKEFPTDQKKRLENARNRILKKGEYLFGQGSPFANSDFASTYKILTEKLNNQIDKTLDTPNRLRREAEEKELNKLIKEEEKVAKQKEKLAKQAADAQIKEAQRRNRQETQLLDEQERKQWKSSARRSWNTLKNAPELPYFTPSNRISIQDNLSHQIDRSFNSRLSGDRGRDYVQWWEAAANRLEQKEKERLRIHRQQEIALQRQLQTTKSLTGQFGQLGTMARQYFNLWAIRAFANNIVRITAEFDMQRRALGSLINDQARAVGMFAEIKSMALESPYTAMQLTTATKQLAAYSIKTKDLIKTTKMLGDISSATGVEISRLILAYGQVKTAHYLRGQEVRQFTEAGVPLLEELAKVFTSRGKFTTSEQVQKMIQGKGVRFTDVREALENLTSNGGRFQDFQYEIAQTTYGKIRKFQDALQQGWDRLGKQQTGIMNSVLDLGVKIAKNLSGYAKILLSTLATWTAINSIRKANLAISNKEEDLMQRTLMARQLQQTATNPAVASYYGDAANRWEKQARKIQGIRKQIQDITIQTRQANVSAGALGKSWNNVGGMVKKAGLGVKMFFVTFKSAMISTGIGVLLTALGALVGKLWAAHDAIKAMQKDLADIDKEVIRSTIRHNEKLKIQLDAIVKMKRGSQEQLDTIQKVRKENEGILTAQDLEIGNLIAMNGQYDDLYKKVRKVLDLWQNNSRRAVVQQKYEEDAIKALTPYVVGHEVEKKIIMEGRNGSMVATIERIATEEGENQRKRVMMGAIDYLTANNPKKGNRYTDEDVRQAIKITAKNLNFDARDWGARAGVAKAIKDYLDQLERYPLLARPDEDDYGGTPETETNGVKQDPTEGWNNFIAFLDRAKERSEKLKELYDEAIALAKTEEEFKEQFEQIADEYKKITGKDTLREMIASDESYKEILKAYMDAAKKASAQATDRWYKHAYDKFRFNFLAPKLSDVEMRATDRYIDEFIKNLDRQLDKTKNRINIYEKLFDVTGNEFLSHQIAETFYGRGNMSEMGATKEYFTNMMKEFAPNIDISALEGGGLFDWQALEEQIMKLPSKTRDNVLKVFKEFKATNAKILEDALNAYEKYQSIEERRVILHTKTQKKIRDIEQGSYDKQSKQMAIENRLKAEQKQLMELELEAIKTSDIYLELFNNIENASVSALSTVREQLIALRKESKDLSPKDLKAINEEIKKIDKVLQPKRYNVGNIFHVPSKKEIRNTLNEIDKVQRQIDEKREKSRDLTKEDSVFLANKKREYSELGFSEKTATTLANNDIQVEQDALTNEITMLTEQQNKLQMQLYDYTSLHNKAIEQWLQNISQFEQKMQSLSQLMTGVVQTMQNISNLRKGTDIGKGYVFNSLLSGISTGANIVSGLSGIGTSAVNTWKNTAGNFISAKENRAIANQRGANAFQSALKAGADVGDALTAGTNAAAEATKKATSTMMAGWAGVAGAAIQVGVAIYESMVQMHDAKIQKEIDDINDSIRELDKNLNNIQHFMNKSAGNQYFRGMKQQTEMYQKQMVLAQQQAEKARQKKRADSQEIQSYEEKAEQYREQIIQKQEEMFQSLLGSDVKGYLENIVNVFTQAKEAGQNTFSALKKSFGEMVSSMVQKMIMTTIIKAKFQRLFDQIEDMVNRGGMGSTDVDRMIATGLQATAEANNALQAMYPVIKRINTAFGVTASTAGGLIGGVKGMTEESAATLSGFMMANFDRLGEIQKSVFAIQQSMGATAGDVMSAYQTQALDNLVKIEAHTALNAQKAQQVYDLLLGMRVINNSGSGAIYALQTKSE